MRRHVITTNAVAGMAQLIYIFYGKCVPTGVTRQLSTLRQFYYLAIKSKTNQIKLVKIMSLDSKLCIGSLINHIYSIRYSRECVWTRPGIPAHTFLGWLWVIRLFPASAVAYVTAVAAGDSVVSVNVDAAAVASAGAHQQRCAHAVWWNVDSLLAVFTELVRSFCIITFADICSHFV